MGLIQEVRDVGYTLNKQERIRREKEKKKILEQNYKTDIIEYLTAEFASIYRNYDIEDAKEIIIQNKDNIINKLYKQLYNRHYLQKSNKVELIFLKSPPWDNRWRFSPKFEKVFLYQNFDIISDLDNKYYIVAEKVEKEERKRLIVQNKKLLDILRADLIKYMNLDDNKYLVSIALRQNENITSIIDSITTDENEKDLLLNNYNKILKNVLKLYEGDILKDKEGGRAEKEKAKIEHKNKTIKWLLFNYAMTEILRILPKPFNKKRKY